MKIAVVTMSYNERVYLPIWSRYYANAVGARNLFVIDHGSDDGSIDLLPRGTNVVSIPRADSFDEVPRTEFINSFQHALLQYYDILIYCDTDEIITPDPEIYDNFLAYFDQCADLVAPVGLQIFQATDREARISSAKPVLGQRRYCQFTTFMCKPIITKKAVNWSLGFHQADHQPFYAKDIYLFHLKSIDYEQSMARLNRTRSMSWSSSNIDSRISVHHRISDEALAAAFFGDPLRHLIEAENLSFDFSAEVDRASASCRLHERFFQIDDFNGHVAQIPERFIGLF